MFKFLSFFSKNKDEKLNDNDYDFVETPSPVIGVEGKIDTQMSALIDTAFDRQPKDPVQAISPTDAAKQAEADQTRMGQIRGELGLSVDPQPPTGEIIDKDKAENPFFKEGPITSDELTEPVTAFGFRLEPPIEGQEPGNAEFRSDDEGTSIVAYFPTDVRSKLTDEQREQFDISDDGKTVTYPKKGQGVATTSVQDEGPPEDHSADEGYNAPLMMDNLAPRVIPEDERAAKSLTSEELAELIRDTPGDELVIYTGAGISKGGAEPVWDMSTLENNVHVAEGSDAFFQELVRDPRALAEAFSEFRRQINTSNPTAAHRAIKDIMDAKSGATLMTQNGDRNHEASGVRPIHMASLPEFFEFLKGRTEKASLIVTAGLHADELSFLNWIATKNPNVKIAAIDLGRSIATYPSYLNKDDYILPGDAQQTLPKVAEALRSN